MLSPLAQRKRRFAVQRLDIEHDHDGWKPLVVEDKHFSPADTAIFRLDFEDWLRSLNRLDRRIIAALISGERATAIADRLGVSDGRISHLRHRYQKLWQVFQKEAAPAA